MASRGRTAAVLLLVLGALGAGCEIIAGLQDRQLEPGDATVDATPDVGPACNPPHTVCFAGDASQCIDTTGDINHCGGCNRTCSGPDAGVFDATSGNPDPGIPSYEAGADAQYVSVPGPACEAGKCGLECGSAQLCGDGLCYDTQNFHDRCGDCMTACPASQWCHGGHCCDAGMESCDGGCIDVVANDSNCGGCGIQCEGGAPTCSGGACVSGVVFTDVFTYMVTPTTQCTDWNNFRAKLTGSYTSITVSGSFDTVGHTCTGPTANTLCQALRTGAATGSLVCNGNTWAVTTCGSTVEINANANGTCQCQSPGYDLRPCLGSYQWGGVNSVTCSPPTQTMTVLCQ